MWNYIIGPILAFLPKNWREPLPFANNVRWGRATAVSGIVESVAAIAALGYWYMYAMSLWVDRSVSRALEGKLGANPTVQEIAAVALTVWMTHPLTLFLGYCLLEGMLRFAQQRSANRAWGYFRWQ